MADVTAHSLLADNITSAIELFQRLGILAEPLEQAARLIADGLVGGHKLITCGNGGSAADASHLATEFVVRFQRDRRPYPALALTDAGGTLTAIGNDYTFDQVFERQVLAFGQKGDVLIALSTSGQSRNVLLALQAAKKIGMATVAMLGKDGGAMQGLADVELLVPHGCTARIQEAHTLLYHCLCELVERELR